METQIKPSRPLTPKQARFYRALWLLPDHSGTARDIVRAGYVARGEGRSIGQVFRGMTDYVKSEDSDHVHPRFGTPVKLYTAVGPEAMEIPEIDQGPSAFIQKNVKEYPVLELVDGDRGPVVYDDGEYAPQDRWVRIYGEPHGAESTFPELRGTHVEIPVEETWIGVGPQEGPEFGGYICLPVGSTVELYEEDKQGA